MKIPFFKHREVEPLEKPQEVEQAWTLPSLTSLAGGSFEVYSPDELIWRKGAKIYDKMMHDDQIKASIRLYSSLVVSRPWRFKTEENNEQHAKIVELFEFNLEKVLIGTFGSVLKGMLSARQFGFSLSEKIWEITEFEGKSVWLVKAIKLKPWDSFTVSMDTFGNVEHLLQTQGEKTVKLDYNKFIHYVNKPEIHSFYGESELRAVYDPYWRKGLISKLWAIWLERIAGGILIAKTPKGLSAEETTRLERVITNVNVSTAIRLPADVEVEIIHAPSTEAFERAESKQNVAISRGLLVPGLMGFSEQQTVGSLARAEVEANIFAEIVKEEGDNLADVLNEQLFRELAWYNFGEKDPPLFVFEPQTDGQKRELVKVWLEVVKAGAAKVTLGDENRVRRLLEFDEVEEEKEEEQEPIEEEKEPVKNPEEPIDKEFELAEISASRIDFVAREKELTGLDVTFEKELLNGLRSVSGKIKKEAVLIFKTGKPDMERLNNKIGGAPTRELKRIILRNLESVYNTGRVAALKTIKKAGKEKGKDFGFIAFQKKVYATGISIQEAEAFFESLAFQISKDTTSDLLRKVGPILANSLQTGASEEMMVNDIEDSVKTYLGTEEVGSRIQAIVRTNVTNLFVQAQLSVYNDPDLEGFVEALQYIIVSDNKTTPFCLGYEGFIAPLNDPIWNDIAPPNHYI